MSSTYYAARYDVIINTLGVNGGYRPSPRCRGASDSESERRKYLTRCYAQRNLYLARNCSCLPAVWKGSSRSGTVQTVRMAREENKTVIQIDPRKFL